MVSGRQISDQNGRRRGECSEKEVGGMVTVAPPTVGWREDAIVAPCTGAPKGTL